MGVVRWPINFDADRGRLEIGPARPLDLPKGDRAISLDTAGKIVAKANRDVAFVATPKWTRQVGPLNDCRDLSVSPDGQWLATGSSTDNRGAQVWRRPPTSPK